MMLGIISNANFRISENRQYFYSVLTFYSFLRIELSDNKKIPNFQEKIKVFQDMVQHIKIDKKNARTGHFAVQNA